MIRAVISLICENSTAVLTPAEPPTPIISVPFYTPGLWDSILLWWGQARPTSFQPQDSRMSDNKTGYLSLLKMPDGLYMTCQEFSLIAGMSISAAGSA